MYYLKLFETISTYRMTETLNLVRTEFQEGKASGLYREESPKLNCLPSYSLL